MMNSITNLGLHKTGEVIPALYKDRIIIIIIIIIIISNEDRHILEREMKPLHLLWL